MTIYFAGHEPDVMGVSTITTTSTTYDTTFSRCATLEKAREQASFTLNSEFGAGTANGYWIRALLRMNQTGVFDQNQVIMWVSDDTGLRSGYVDLVNRDLRVGLYDSAQTFQGYQSTVELLYSHQDNFLDLHVWQDGADGKAELFLNGTSIGTATHTGSTTLGIFRVRLGGAVDNTAYYTYFSEVIVADESTIGMRVKTLYPTADGFHTNWNGGYADLSDADPTMNAIRATAVGDSYSYQTAGLGALESYLVKAVVLNGIAGSNGTNDLQAFVRKSSTDYFSSSLGVGTGAIPVYNVWNTDPATATDWVASDVSNLEFGFKAVT